MSSGETDTDEERVQAQVQSDQGELTLLDLNPTIPVSSDSDGEIVEAVSPDERETGTASAETWSSPARTCVPSAASTGCTGKTTMILRPGLLYVDSEGPFMRGPWGTVVKIRPMWRSLPVLHWVLKRKVGRRKDRGRIRDPVPRLGRNSGPMVVRVLDDGETTAGRSRPMIETSPARTQSRGRVPINEIENPQPVEALRHERVRREALAEDVPKTTVRRRMRGKQAPMEERARS